MNKTIKIILILITLSTLTGCQLATKENITSKKFFAAQVIVKPRLSGEEETHTIYQEIPEGFEDLYFDFSNSIYEANTEIKLDDTDGIKSNFVISNTTMQIINTEDVTVELSFVYIDNEGNTTYQEQASVYIPVGNGGTFSMNVSIDDEYSEKNLDFTINLEQISPIKEVIAYGYDKQHELMSTDIIENADDVKKEASFYLYDLIYEDKTVTLLDKDFIKVPRNGTYFMEYDLIDFEETE